MIKGLYYIYLFISLFLGDYLFTKEASIYAKYPSEVSVGGELEVFITVEKGNLTQFGRFQQTLPLGFSATSESNLFEFNNQKVKFIWISLPAGNTFTFSYKIIVPANYTGSIPIEGEFAYIMDNERKIVKLNAGSVIALPAGVALSKKENHTSSGNDLVPPKENVFCNREVVKQGNQWLVKILVNKDNLSNMAKVTEDIPVGYSAQEVDTKDAIFTFGKNVVKFMWMNLPMEKEFYISYLLTPQQNTTAKPKIIKGEFSYSVNNLTQTILITDKVIDKKEKVIVAENVVSQPETKVVKNESVNIKSSNSLPVYDTKNSIIYRIQIAASHKKVNSKKYFKKYKIEDKVFVDLHEGWHKYMIKSFNEYKTAKDFRDKVWTVTPIDDAFITAYNNGERITIQEALMITNQQWFK